MTKDVRSLLDLAGRVAIVTGASGNIGGGIARRLHEAGASVVVHAGGRLEAAEALATELGDGAAAVAGDVERDAAAICRSAVTAFGRLDIVVNIAGNPLRRSCRSAPPTLPSCCASTSGA